MLSEGALAVVNAEGNAESEAPVNDVEDRAGNNPVPAVHTEQAIGIGGPTTTGVSAPGHVGQVQEDPVTSDSDGGAGSRDAEENVAERLQHLLTMVARKKAYYKDMRDAIYKLKNPYKRPRRDEDDEDPGSGKKHLRI